MAIVAHPTPSSGTTAGPGTWIWASSAWPTGGYLAVATWSTTWNYGPGREIPLLDAYGIAPDGDRIRYYRLLWELGP